VPLVELIASVALSTALPEGFRPYAEVQNRPYGAAQITGAELPYPRNTTVRASGAHHIPCCITLRGPSKTSHRSAEKVASLVDQ
jgi:hypothetical protein